MRVCWSSFPASQHCSCWRPRQRRHRSRPTRSLVLLNEINCTGTDWVELSTAATSRRRSGAGCSPTTRSIGCRCATRTGCTSATRRCSRRAGGLVVAQGAGGFPFGLSCGDDTLRLADAADTLVDAFMLPVLATGGMTYGRIPDGTGEWTWTLPTAGTSNAVAPDTQGDDPAWLYDPLACDRDRPRGEPGGPGPAGGRPGRVRRRADHAAQRLRARTARISVGLRLKGHTAFRTLDGKAAFKVKFGYAVSGQRFFGLKGLTLNNMVQDPSMIAEATTSLLVAATGAPAARVGYAYVRLNGADYGLYANVETIDAVMAHRWFDGHAAHLRGELRRTTRAPAARAVRGGRGLVHRPLRPRGAVVGQCRRRGRLVGADAAGRGSRGDDPRLGGRALRGALGRLLGRAGDEPEQLLPAQRPRGPLLPDRQRH